VGAFWGLLVALFAAFAFVIVWPIRRLLRRRRGAPVEAARQQGSEGGVLRADQRGA
jgi:membrane protein implicated in regulation of membrane protease activity